MVLRPIFVQLGTWVNRASQPAHMVGTPRSRVRPGVFLAGFLTKPTRLRGRHVAAMLPRGDTAMMKPNIVYFLVDDMGYGDASCLNPSGRIQTPSIDRVAREGMVFTDAHSSSAVCSPSRYSILTGRYNWRSTLQRGIAVSYTHLTLPTN